MNHTVIQIKSFLFLLVCELCGFFINMMFPMMYNSMGLLACIFFSICTLGATACIYGDWCIKMGGKHHLRSDTPEDEKNKQHYGLIVGIVPTVVNYIYVIILYLSKLEIIKADLYPLYKTLTFYFMPLTYFVAPNTSEYIDGRITTITMAATELPWYAMLLFTILPLFFLLVCWGFYYIGYNHIDMKEKILYRPTK